MFGTLKNNHSSHPDFGHLVLLVFEAVLEVVIVAAPGYIVARRGMFGAEAQKFVANLNVQIFTPCLVFTKLASQLNAGKLADLVVIPIIFVVQTLVSWTAAKVVSKICGFDKRKTNFVIAMGVFGNSNSLPISLVISLSKTLRGLHWDQIPGDNDNEVAARGILYLLIFQQLGQLLRWSWGYNVLLKPATEEQDSIEEGRYHDDEEEQGHIKPNHTSDYGSGTQSPHTISTSGSSASLQNHPSEAEPLITPSNGNIVHRGSGNLAGRESHTHHEPSPGNVARYPSANHITRFPSYRTLNDDSHEDSGTDKKTVLQSSKDATAKVWHKMTAAIAMFFQTRFRALPNGIQKPLRAVGSWIFRFFNAIWQSMNPPLWAMIASVVVASVPALQKFFFEKGTFMNNSVTHAISQNGNVAVPLILVVLGANLARNTLPQEELDTSPEDKKDEKKMLWASLISRMLLPSAILAPFLALFAKYVPVSILDDPIFIIVCFLLTGAPSALQLAQICQLNNVFMPVMSKLLFQSYVIWILPSTLILVMLALETVEWATAV
ncbi:putative membrane transport protein [Elsinoe fawcettii]|nr:putative membrane transport protein [Elsinoe fawcettii]